MTQAPSVEGSPSVAKIGVALLLAAAVALYVSGYFFLWAIRETPLSATPLTTLRYWHHYGDRPDVRRVLLWSLAGGMGLTFGAGAIAVIPRRRALHGDARFATKREIRKAKLLGHEGIILGRLGNEYLMLPGQQGVELEAPPRSGKGVGVVIPNLLNWPGSVIVSDIKGENWMRTAGFRSTHGQDVHLFDPLSEVERSSRWNPLAYVSEIPFRCIDDLQRIATMLYPDPQGADPFWTSSARSLFLGIALYLFETEGATRTIGEILRQGMASDAEGFQKHWRRVIDSCERAGYPLSQEAIQTLYDVIDMARKVAAFSEFFGVKTAWHGPGDCSPVGHAAQLALELASHNFGIHEGGGFGANTREVFPGCPEVRQGAMWATEAPGFGIDVDEKLAAKFPFPPGPPDFDYSWGRTRRRDGTVIRP